MVQCEGVDIDIDRCIYIYIYKYDLAARHLPRARKAQEQPPAIQCLYSSKVKFTIEIKKKNGDNISYGMTQSRHSTVYSTN